METLNEYQKLALRTAPAFRARVVQPIQDFLIHAQMGLQTEVAEIIEKPDDEENVHQEIGDVMWYVALGCSGLGVDLKDLDTDFMVDDAYNDLVIQAGIFADCVKRHVFYSTPEKTVEFNEDKALKALGCIVACLRDLCGNDEYLFMNLCEKNIEKLKKRYPDKFSGEAAMNRNVAEEEKIFEK